MPIASNATANMSRRQSFNGKGLTFIEMMFDDEVTTLQLLLTPKVQCFKT